MNDMGLLIYWINLNLFNLFCLTNFILYYIVLYYIVLLSDIYTINL